MRTTRFLFAIIACSTWTLGVGYAGEPSSPPSAQVPTENHATGGHPAPAKPAQANPAPGKTEQTDEKDLQPKDDNHHTDSKDISQHSNSKNDSHPVEHKDVSQRKDDKHHAERKDDAHQAKGKEKSLHVARKEEGQHAERKEAESKKAALAAIQGKSQTKNHLEQSAKSPVGSEAVASHPGVVRFRNTAGPDIGAVRMTATSRYSAGALDGSAVKMKH